METKTKRSVPVKTLIFDYLIIFAGCVIYAISIAVFTAPYNIAPGGVIGICTVINYLAPFLPIGVMTFVINIPIFIWGGITLGWKYMTRSIVTTAISSVLIDIFSLDIIAEFIKPFVGEMDTILVALFGGLLCGAGLALIFYRGSSTGGSDIVSRIMHEKLPHLSIGNFILMIDVCVVTFSAFVYGNIEAGFYALICIFISVRVIDTVLYGVSRNNGKLLFIVTSRYDEVCEEIMQKVDRGVTLLKAEGGYKRDDKRVVLCAVRPQQVHKSTLIVKEIDPEAFIIITTANSIKGRGFPSIDEMGNESEKLYMPTSKPESEDKPEK